VLVRGWSEGSIQQKAKAEVAVGNLRNEKAEEDEAPARPGEEGILARIVGQGSNSHQNTVHVFLYSCIHTILILLLTFTFWQEGLQLRCREENKYRFI
jgi:hypothetical protein